MRCSTKSKEFRRLLDEREQDNRLRLKLIEERENKINKILAEEVKQKEILESLKVDWRLELQPQETSQQEEVLEEEIKVNVPEKLKSNWREELCSEEQEEIQEDSIVEEKIEVPEHLRSNWRQEINEGMTSSGVFFLKIGRAHV